MFDLIDGLPLHPLVVHGVVVLVPLTVLGTVALALRPRWRHTFGPLLVAVSAVATVLVVVAEESGEALATHVGDPGEHARLGGQLLWFALPLLVLDVALVVLDRRKATSRNPLRVVAALALVAALTAGVQVYRVGDSGARAAWGGRVQSTVPAETAAR